LNALKSEIANVFSDKIAKDAAASLAADKNFLGQFAVMLASKWAGNEAIVLSSSEAESLREYFSKQAKELLDKGVTTKTVQNRWQKLIDAFGSEIDVLINVSLDEIKKIDSDVANIIESFRNSSINVVPGGGGQYGKILFDNKVKENKTKKLVTLDNF
jgi:hypothetical protein